MLRQNLIRFKQLILKQANFLKQESKRGKFRSLFQWPVAWFESLKILGVLLRIRTK